MEYNYIDIDINQTDNGRFWKLKVTQEGRESDAVKAKYDLLGGFIDDEEHAC
jgi:hypothetical protein